ncbi:MAG: efflux RND transporter periplasmic adaptor subunit [Cyanothece sp. SIO1E1]|nr:efflux RND transporter periplasmic adaptor subunit [Cyanothece sp. SIO1E1]
MSVERVNAYQITQRYTGEVAALRASELGFERSGKLVWLGVDDGDRIATGAAIAKLDTRNLEAQRQGLLAQKAQAVAVLAELQQGARAEDIAAARSAVRDLEDQVELQRIRQTRRQSLYTEGAISKEELDEIAFGANALSDRLDVARSNLDELLNGTRPEQIAAQQAAVNQLEASIADMEITIEKSTMRAPFAGTIANRRLDEGTVVTASTPVVRLVEDIEPEVEIGVPVAVASQLQTGSRQPVQIGQQTYVARISSILPEVDPATRTRKVILALAPAAAKTVSPGEVARLETKQTIAGAGYWLPTTALARGERGLWSCYALVDVNADGALAQVDSKADVESDGQSLAYRVERRDVEVLHTEGDRVLVRGALQPGDQIVANGVQRLVPDQLVRPIAIAP